MYYFPIFFQIDWFLFLFYLLLLPKVSERISSFLLRSSFAFFFLGAVALIFPDLFFAKKGIEILKIYSSVILFGFSFFLLHKFEQKEKSRTSLLFSVLFDTAALAVVYAV